MHLLNSTHTNTLIKIGKWLYWISLMQEFVFHIGIHGSLV